MLSVKRDLVNWRALCQALDRFSNDESMKRYKPIETQSMSFTINAKLGPFNDQLNTLLSIRGEINFSIRFVHMKNDPN